jgi:5-formyltetrahydrofolate cyclo-ligase
MLHINENETIQKSTLRKQLLAQRLNLVDDHRSTLDSQIIKRVISDPLFRQATKIACYYSHLNEPNLLSLITLATTKSFYLPILKKSSHGDSFLVFGPCKPDTKYVNNIYGIPEPHVTDDLILGAEDLDLILLPLVGFDATKKRLGMGGGFYDRTLSFKLKNPKEKPYLVGVAYECQKVDSIPTENHDITLDTIVTESRLY